jgi:DNA-binding transcriptional ArsR family regulator
MRVIMDCLKALGDANRLRALYALRNGELCVCQLIALLELAPSTVSKHLTILRNARLVESRKEGRWMYYRLSKEFNPAAVGKVLALLFGEMEQTHQMAADEKRLKRICSEELDALCRRLFCKP